MSEKLKEWRLILGHVVTLVGLVLGYLYNEKQQAKAADRQQAVFEAYLQSITSQINQPAEAVPGE